MNKPPFCRMSVLAFWLGFACLTPPLAAQTTYPVTTATDLTNSISSINSGEVSAGIELYNSTPINFSGTLATLDFGVTFSDATGVGFPTITNSTAGVAVSFVSTALVEVEGGSSVVFLGGGNLGQDGSGNGLAGNTGAVSAAAVNVDPGSSGQGLFVGGGAGSNSTGTGAGGNGGGAYLTAAGAVSINDGAAQLTGGTGGQAVNTNGGSGGNGGTAVLSSGSLVAVGGSHVDVNGGFGGASSDNTDVSGAGGAATLSVSGAVSIDSSIVFVQGGGGGDSSTAGGNSGGGAFTTLEGGLTILGTNSASHLDIEGGDGGSATLLNGSFASGGGGGNAGLAVSGSVSVDSSTLEVEGGNAGYGAETEGNEEGAGGSAGVSLGRLTLTSTNYGLNQTGTGAVLQVSGGIGGVDNSQGDGGLGGGAALTVSGPVSMDSSSVLVQGGAGGNSDLGEGGNGGNAAVSIGSGLAVNSSFGSPTAYSVFSITGGVGGANKGGGLGGDGGDAGLTVSDSVSVDSSGINVVGGDAGPGSDGGGLQEGSGGSAAVSMASLDITDNANSTSLLGHTAYLNVLGGTGGTDGYAATGGDGGAAGLTVSGAVLVDSSSISVTGGDAGTGFGSAGTTEGNGGGASVSIDSLSLTSDGYYQNGQKSTYASFGVFGGSGGDDGGQGTGGTGGAATLALSGGVSMDSSDLSVQGGGGGDSSSGAGGEGGNALVTVGGGVTLTGSYHSSAFNVAGGLGGSSDGAGAGGNGGSAGLSISGAVSMNESNLGLTGGTGGDSSTGTGGTGGSVSFAGGTVVLNDSSTLSFSAGNGGTGATAGNGGNASVSAGSMTLLDKNSQLEVFAGNANAGGVAGSAMVTLGSLNGSGTVTVWGGTALLQVGSGSFSGVLAGDETLSAVGAALTLSGNNTYSGGTTLETGTLALGNSSALGTGNLTLEAGTTLLADAADLAVTNNGTLNGSDTFAFQGFNWTLSGALGGSGSLAVTSSSGGGGLTLTGNNTYSGGTTLEAGTLALGNSDALGTGNLTLQAGTTLQAAVASLAVNNNIALDGTGTYDTNGLNSSLSGVISGSAALSVVSGTGSGALTLTGSNNYTGGTFIAANALVNIQNNGNLGTGDVYLNGGTLQAGASGLNMTTGISLYSNGGTFDNNGYDTTLGAVAGAATFTLTGPGAVTLTAQVNTSGLNIDSGTVVTANTWILPSIDPIFIASSATLNLNGNTQQVGALTGSGQIQLGSANLNINNQDTGCLFAGDISGIGNVYYYGTAPLTLTGDSTYSGGTDIGGGTLAIGSDENWGTGSVTLTVSSTLLLIGSFNTSKDIQTDGNVFTIDTNGYNLAIGGDILEGNNNGSLVKNGTGTLTLSGDNSYNDGTNLNAGTLVAASSSALGVGGVTVNGGTLALSGPITVNIGGNYTQASGGNLLVGMLGGQGSLLDIAGTASLAGGLTVTSYNGSAIHIDESVTILEASSVSGTFGTVTDGVRDSTASLVYGASDVVLDLDTTATFASFGKTENQVAVGDVLDTLAAKSQSSTLITYLNLQSNSALPADYDLISPANLAPIYQMGFATAQAEADLVEARLTRVFGNGGGAAGRFSMDGQGPLFAANVPAAQEAGMVSGAQSDPWGVFAEGLGNFGTVTGDGNGPGYQYSTGGAVAGMDYRFSRNFTAGLLLGYASSGTGQSTGSVGSTGGQAGLYAGWKNGSFHAEAVAAGGINSYTTQRTALGGTATGSTQGTLFSGEISLGYDARAGGVKWGPFAAGQYANVGINAFTETGSQAPLSYPAQSEGFLKSDLGVSASRAFNLGGGTSLAPALSAAWEHLYQGNLDSLEASLGPGGNFTVNGPALGANAAVLGAGADLSFSKGFSLYARYQGKVGQTDYFAQDVSGGVNIGF